jgi:hypothetical protein
MKAKIEHDCLWLTPESSTEQYAFEAWSEKQGLNLCTNEITTKNLWCYAYRRHIHKSLIQRIRLWLLNIRYSISKTGYPG